MRTFLYVLGGSTIANILFALALSTVISFEILFSDSVEWFHGGAKLADLLTAIALSYIAGYIFYLSTEVRRKVNSIHSTKLTAHRHCGKVISLANEVFFSITKVRDVPEENVIRENINKIKINDIVPGKTYTFDGNSSQQVQYNYYFPYCVLPEMQSLENDIANVSHLLEPEITTALDNVFNCSFKSQFGNKMVAHINHKDSTLALFEKAFLDLSEKTKLLKNELHKIYGESPWSASNKLQAA
ncbi:hypothetical protein MO867_22090 [Microbulbifer sp. OS29]|uniref:Uncharacterized protein n=1 Tax=Microbulbifer okhotskensis TaxID=2926617 RepID=A0A9X2J7B7_9GAMM|nr:hypothetical protein [Microbulbifer okhotskensis]MCO1337018.1 hypothetical protein [Microbulbifer okhotskensis]